VFLGSVRGGHAPVREIYERSKRHCASVANEQMFAAIMFTCNLSQMLMYGVDCAGS
jgi:hypothetical protein